jgi:hypothetical protein
MATTSKMHMRVLKARKTGNIGGGKFVYDTSKLKFEDEEEGHYGQWGWEGRNKANKGLRLGSCNVTACQRPGAYWYNSVMKAWYCTSCAHEINYRPLPNGEYLCILNEEARKEYFDALENDPE